MSLNNPNQLEPLFLKFNKMFSCFLVNFTKDHSLSCFLVDFIKDHSLSCLLNFIKDRSPFLGAHVELKNCNHTTSLPTEDMLTILCR